MTAHAELRAILEALSNSSSLPPGIPLSERCWILSAPALVRALLDERDQLADKLAEFINGQLRAEMAELRTVTAERDRLATDLELERTRLGVCGTAAEDSRFIPKDEHDSASLALVMALRAERDKLAQVADNTVDLLAKNADLRAERDALKAEIERLRAKPVTPEQLFSSSKVIWEGWVRARDEEGGCVLDLFNGRVERSRYVRVVEAEQPQKPVHPKWPADPMEPAHPAEPITDELRLRCELAATVLPILAQWGKEHGIEGPFRDAVVNEAHHYADALLDEGRRRMAAEREGKP